jgi:hypothetical protein
MTKICYIIQNQSDFETHQTTSVASNRFRPPC